MLKNHRTDKIFLLNKTEKLTLNTDHRPLFRALLILFPLKIDVDWPSFRQTTLLLFSLIKSLFVLNILQIFDVQGQAFFMTTFSFCKAAYILKIVEV